jgi:hypothetical protein
VMKFVGVSSSTSFRFFSNCLISLNLGISLSLIVSRL